MFQRLVAIPQEEYMQLKTLQRMRQPVKQQFYDLENRYREGEGIVEPYKRLVTQSEVLDEMKDLKEKMRQGIVESTPKPYQARAKTLFQSLEPFLRINERGEIFDDNNQLVHRSRIEDLIQHAVRDRRRNLIPEGWSEFRHILQSHNVPKFMLNRDTLDEMSKDGVNITETKNEDSKKEKKKKEEVVKKEPTMLFPTRLRKPNPKYGEKYGFIKHY